MELKKGHGSALIKFVLQYRSHQDELGQEHPDTLTSIQPGVDIPESRAVEEGRGAGGASNGDEKEGAGEGASRHADQHGQPDVDV
jgi:hypothetical protein